MKHLFFSLLLGLIIVLSIDVRAGGFKCNSYLIEFTVKSEIFRGHYLTGNNEQGVPFQQESFLNHFMNLAQYGTDSIEIYTKIETLAYPKLVLNTLDSCDFKLTCAYPNHIIKLKVNDIRAVKLIDVFPCGVCDPGNKLEGYYWNGIGNSVITELTASEIELLNKEKPEATHDFTFGIEDAATCYVMNYNRQMSIAEFESICEKVKKAVKENSYDHLKEQLRSKNIILMRLYFTV